MIYSSVLQLIGNTPLVELCNIKRKYNLKARIVAKIESFNPGGSAKDRIALSMVEDAEKRGGLKPGGTIIEPTSGNTGVGLAMTAACKGYKLILTMPENMSIERQRLLSAYGATLVLTPGNEGMDGAIKKAEELASNIDNSLILRQFENPVNPLAHQQSTAEEIWRETEGCIDILVASVGTGGTLCGTAKGLKRHNPQIQTVAVEPSNSPVLGGGMPGKHRIQGIGAGFIPQNYDATCVDQIISVADEDALSATCALAHEEGILAGISSGAAIYAAIQLAEKTENTGKNIVVIFPDTGERYLSENVF